MTTTYEIRHVYGKLDRNEMMTVQTFSDGYERAARIRYEELICEYPGKYFELRIIQHEEKVIDFTPATEK